MSPMTRAFACKAGKDRSAAVVLLLTCQAIAFATDWSQYRGPTLEGFTPDRISLNWPSGGPAVVWKNMTLTNGFSTFAVSQGRAFVVVSRKDAADKLLEYCIGVEVTTGATLWATAIGAELWNPSTSDSTTTMASRDSLCPHGFARCLRSTDRS